MQGVALVDRQGGLGDGHFVALGIVVAILESLQGYGLRSKLVVGVLLNRLLAVFFWSPAF